jgi:SAM-dependent methyltransferase
MNEYDRFAEYYDLFYRGYIGDRQFYLETWENFGKPAQVLELACGTGRLLVPLAQAGLNITGVDLSEPMLKVCRERLDAEPPEVQERTRLRQGDMCHLDQVFGEEKFDLIILAFNTFQHFLTAEVQLACLTSAYNQLNKGGHFIISVDNPAKETDLDPAKKAEFWGKFPNLARNSVIKLLVSVTGDSAKQILHRRYQFFEELPDESIELTVASLDFYYFYHDQLKALLEKVGFSILETYGEYSFVPFTEKRHNIIFVCTA